MCSTRSTRTSTSIVQSASSRSWRATIEIDRLGEPIGKQDQYIAAVGGVTAFEFEADDDVDVQPLDLSPETRARLEDNLLLFYTGVRRSASDVLAIETDGVGRAPATT